MATGSGLSLSYLIPLILTHISQDLIVEDKDTHGTMFTPIILSSDKTTVSVATGQTEYYPLYLSLGNLHNNMQHARSGSVAVVTFLAILKGKLF